jgi:hypothetical protein
LTRTRDHWATRNVQAKAARRYFISIASLKAYDSCYL